MRRLGWKVGDAVILEKKRGSIVISRVESIKTLTGRVISLVGEKE
jgi:bifunctional DNA-binding transcriptional regulator/antitoxin component of YhaV-PrlF toxin-antitoxin module